MAGVVQVCYIWMVVLGDNCGDRLDSNRFIRYSIGRGV